jgi:hypothetical protein
MEAANSFETQGRAYQSARPHIFEARNADPDRYVTLSPHVVQWHVNTSRRREQFRNEVGCAFVMQFFLLEKKHKIKFPFWP